MHQNLLPIMVEINSEIPEMKVGEMLTEKKLEQILTQSSATTV